MTYLCWFWLFKFLLSNTKFHINTLSRVESSPAPRYIWDPKSLGLIRLKLLSKKKKYDFNLLYWLLWYFVHTSKVKESKAMDRIILTSVTIKCPQGQLGCNWQGDISSVEVCCWLFISSTSYFKLLY